MSVEPTPEPSRDPEGDLAAVTREAASRRRELRAEQAAKAEVAAERDALRTRLDEMYKRQIRELAGQKLAEADDLWLAASIDEMRGDDGEVDLERALIVIEDVVERKPHWAVREPAVMPNVHGGERPEPPRKVSFGEALKRS